MAKAKLRAAKPGESPPEPTSVAEAHESGDELAIMRQLGIVIAKAIDHPETPARDLAALGNRLIQVEGRISEIVAAREAAEAEAANAATPDERFNVAG